MSTDTLTLKLEERTVIGKQVRALRRDGRVPAVIYNHGKESTIVEAPLLDITKIYEKAGKHHVIDLSVGAQKYLAIIKDVDLDPRKNTIRHIVFDSLKQNEKVKTEVPVKVEGNSPAEKAGLMLLHQLDVIEVEATPRNLPDSIIISIDSLEKIGDKILVSDITAPSGVTILTEPEHPIVSVIETPAQQSDEAEASEESQDSSETQAGEAEPAENSNS